MKVLKEGRSPKWSMKAKCTGEGNGGGGCGALLLVEIGDVFITVRYVHVDTDYFTTFRCVSCGVSTDFTDCPAAVRTAAVKNFFSVETKRQ